MAMDALERYKRDGFKGEQMIVPPIESFQNYIEHPLVQRMYLTDVGYFPNAACHFRERKEGIEENILIYCSEGKGHIFIGSQEYVLHEIPRSCPIAIAFVSSVFKPRLLAIVLLTDST